MNQSTIGNLLTSNISRIDVLNVVLDFVAQGIIVVGPDYRVLAIDKYFEEPFQSLMALQKVNMDFREILKVWTDVTGQIGALPELRSGCNFIAM